MIICDLPVTMLFPSKSPFIFTLSAVMFREAPKYIPELESESSFFVVMLIDPPSVLPIVPWFVSVTMSETRRIKVLSKESPEPATWETSRRELEIVRLLRFMDWWLKAGVTKALFSMRSERVGRVVTGVGLRPGCMLLSTISTSSFPR